MFLGSLHGIYQWSTLNALTHSIIHIVSLSALSAHGVSIVQLFKLSH